MKETVLKINGMICGGCENRVKNRLIEIKGIEKVDANYNSGTVTIYSNNDIKIDDIKSAIVDLGFEVIEDN